MPQITIKLSDSLVANQFGDGERIHYKAFDKAKRLIEAQLRAAIVYKSYLSNGASNIKRSYHAISVFGERGVGKTSFLMSLREYIVNEGLALSRGKISLLPLIDPTLIEEKGHIFLLILSQIDIAVNKVFEEGTNSNSIDYEQSWNEAKAKLAAGLPSLKPEGMTYHEPQWNEDEYVMKNGLNSVNSAFHLEENFHQLVNLALQILHKDAFVLMFDDIDVDFKRGWDLLETVRKFLTTPQIIIILSGNLKLFSKNVRKQQWRNLGKELLKNEVDISGTSAVKEYTQLVNELEGQYLLKILNSENRVYLYDVGKNISMNGDEYRVDYGEEGIVVLDEAYRNVLRQFGILNQSIARVFIDFLESTSMRTQVHFLYNAWCMRRDADEQNMMSAISAFSSRIYAQNVNVELAANETLFNSILLHFLIKQHLVEDAYQLLPTFEDTDINCVVSGLSFLFAMIIKKQPTLVFDYWVKVCQTRNAMRYLTYDSDDKQHRLLSVDRYCQEIGAFQKRNLKSIVGNSLAYALSINDKQTLDSTVRLLGFGGLAKKAGMRNRIDLALYDKAEQQILGYLPLACLLHSDKNQRELYYSFNVLLANIGQIVKIANEDNVMQILLAACQPVSYQIKSDVSSSVNMAEEEESSEIELNLVDDYGVGDLIMQWKAKYSNICYSPDLFGRIATRFFFAQASILENNKNVKLGDLFSLLTMAFFNACLIEEIKSRNDIDLQGFNVNNVSTSSYILLNNIRRLLEIDNWAAKVPFTKWMIGCPLLFPYLDMSDGYVFPEFVEKCYDHEGLFCEYAQKAKMTEILNGIEMYRVRVLSVFSVAQDKIESTIERINDAHIDAVFIFDEANIREAQTQLSKIFKTVRLSQIRSLRTKCRISDVTGNLVLL